MISDIFPTSAMVPSVAWVPALSTRWTPPALGTLAGHRRRVLIWRETTTLQHVAPRHLSRHQTLRDICELCAHHEALLSIFGFQVLNSFVVAVGSAQGIRCHACLAATTAANQQPQILVREITSQDSQTSSRVKCRFMFPTFSDILQ